MSFVGKRTIKADAMLSRPNAVNAKKVANNTFRYEIPGEGTFWRLHMTDVVHKRPDGTFRLKSGGWQTSTTRDRINSYAPVKLIQRDHEWFLIGRAPDGSWDWTTRVPFEDGMVVDARGVPVEQNT